MWRRNGTYCGRHVLVGARAHEEMQHDRPRRPTVWQLQACLPAGTRRLCRSLFRAACATGATSGHQGAAYVSDRQRGRALLPGSANHRDVKPENMLVGRQQEVLLSDFGLAALVHSTGSLSAQEAVGTLPYMAPEQIEGHPRADRKSTRLNSSH